MKIQTVCLTKFEIFHTIAHKLAQQPQYSHLIFISTGGVMNRPFLKKDNALP